MNNENIAIQINVELDTNQQDMKKQIALISDALKKASAGDPQFKIKVPIELSNLQEAINGLVEQIKQIKNTPISPNVSNDGLQRINSATNAVNELVKANLKINPQNIQGYSQAISSLVKSGYDADQFINRLNELEFNITKIRTSFEQVGDEQWVSKIAVSGVDSLNNLVNHIEIFDKEAKGGFVRASTTIQENLAAVVKAEKEAEKQTQTTAQVLEQFTKLNASFEAKNRAYSGVEDSHIAESLAKASGFINEYNNADNFEKQRLAVIKLAGAMQEVTSDVKAYEKAQKEAAKSTQDAVESQRKEAQKLKEELANAAQKITDTNYPVGSVSPLQTQFATLEKAKEYVQNIQGVSSVTESLFRNAQQGIESFTLSVKSASGETEKLKFNLEKIVDPNTGKETFTYVLQNINDANAGVERLKRSTDEWNASLAASQTKYTAVAESLKAVWRDSKGKDLLKNTENVDRLNAEYEKLIATIGSLAGADKAAAKTIIADIEAQIKGVKTLSKEYKNAEQAATDLRSKNPTEIFERYSNEVSQFKQKATAAGVISQMTDEITKLDNALNQFNAEKTKEQLTNFLNAFDTAKSKLKVETDLKKNFDSLNKSITTTVTSLRNMAGLDIYRKFANDPEVQTFKNDLTDLITKFQELKEAIKDTPQNTERYAELKTQFDELIAKFAEAKDKNEVFKQSLRDINAMESARKSAKTLTNQINEYMAANTKAAKKYSDDFNALLGQLNTASVSGDVAGVRALSSEFETLKIRIAEAGDTGQTALQRLAAGIKSLPVVGMYLSISSLAMRAVRNIKEMINNVIELDTQMTALKRVTNETDEAYEQFLTNAGKQAVQLHSSITDLVEQTTAWVKLGNSLEDASLLAENSMMFSRVADIDNETAVKNLVSTMKAFNIEAENSIRIVDILDKLNNEFATSAKDLGSGLSKTASSMAVAGNSLEKTIAMLTGGTEITQNADEMATAMRTISMRIRSMKGELQDLGEEYENVQSLSKIQTQILNYTGVNIFDENENFRDTYDILLDISKVYNDLKDTAKADLTEILFGKLRANQGAAILQAFQTGQIQKAYQAAVSSAGTATKEFEKYSQSIQAHINSYTAATQSLANSVIDDEAIKGFVDTGTKIVQFLDDIVSKTGTLQTLIPIVAGSLSLFKNIGVFRTMTDDLSGLTNQLGVFGKTWNQIGQDLKKGYGLKSFTNLISKTDVTVLQDYSKALAAGSVSANDFEDVLKNSSVSAQLLGKKIIELNTQLQAGTITEQQYTAAVNGMVGAQNAATVSSKALGVALNMALNVGLTIAITAIISGIQALINAEKEAREAAKEAASQAQKEIETLQNLYQEYLDITQAVKDGTKSKQDLREITDSLIKRLGVEWSAVHDLVKEYGNLDNALKYLTAQEIINNLLPDLKAGVDAAEQELLNAGGTINSGRSVTVSKGEAEWLTEWNKRNGNILSQSTGTLGETFWVAYSERGQASLEDLEKEYRILIQLRADMNREGLSETEGYKQISDRLNKIKPLYEAYTSAVEENNKQAAKALVAQKNLNAELPNTFDEYVKYREQMLDIAQSEDYVNLFAGTAKDIEKSIANELSSSSFLSNFEQQLSNLNELSYKYIGRAFNEGVTSGYEAQIRTFLNNLSAEDLEIATQIPDLFEKGLNGASEKIAKFKADPKNALLDEEETKSINDLIDSTTKKVKALTSAMSDINDTGHISSSTYKDLLELGGNFTDCLEVQNGMLTLNVEKLKELETQEIRNTVSANNLKIAELQLEAARRAQAQGDWQSISQMISDLERENEVLSLLREEIVTASPKTSGSGSTKADDTIKAGFEKDMKEVEHLYNMGVKTAEEYYAALEAANEKWYATSAEHESDYLSNVEKLYKGRQQILKDNADKELEILDNQLKLGYIKQEEYDKSLIELAEKYYGEGSTYFGTDFAKDNYKSLVDKATDNDQTQYKENFEKQLKELDKALDKGVLSVEKYRKAYAELRNEWWGEGSRWYGTTFASDMATEMDEALDNVDSLYAELSKQYEKLNDNTRKGNADYIKSMISLNNSLYKANDPQKWQENYADIANEAQDFYKGLLDNGVLDVEQYRNKINTFFNRLKQIGIDLGQSWLSSALNIDDIEYDALKKKLAGDGDKTFADIERDAERLSRKNIRLFADDPKTLKENAEDIFGTIQNAAKDELDKLLITPDKYLEVIERWGENLDVTESVLDEARKVLSESDYLDAWDLQNGYDETNSKNDYDLRANRIKYLRELAEKLYGKDGQDNVRAYNELVKKANDEEKAILEDKLNAEKSYWERRKKEVEEAYDKEIEKLEKTKDEADKLNKATELRIDLIKAQQKAEDAKKQRNQLIFENGTFRYDYDQSAVLSAEEEVAKALKTIQDNQAEEQINLLKEQKTASTEFYDDILEQIDAYADSMEPLAESNNALLTDILSSLPAKNKRDVAEYALESGDSSSVIADKNRANDAIKGTAKLKNTASQMLQAVELFKLLGVSKDIAELSVNAFRNSFAASAPLEIAKTFGKLIEAADRAESIQSIADTRTNVVTVGDISINVQGDTTEKMLIEFAEQLGAAVEAKIGQLTYSNTSNY